MRGACAGAGDDGEDDIFRFRQDGGGVLHDERGLRAGDVAASERWERRDGDCGVGMAARVDDSGRGATGAAEFNFGMRADVGILEHVLRAAVTACCLHGLKVALWRRRGLSMRNGVAEMVMGGWPGLDVAWEGSVVMLELTIPNIV